MQRNTLLIFGSSLVVGVSVLILLVNFVSPKRISQIDPIIPQGGSQAHSLQVVASFFPYAEFARGVTGEHAQVTTLVPAGVEPHDFEPTPRDIEALYQADIVILNGAGIDAWAEKLSPELTKRGIRVLRMIDELSSLENLEKNIPSESNMSEQSSVQQGKMQDSHFWLDPVLAEIQVEKIAGALSSLDPAYREIYESNAEKYQQRLRDLDREYEQGLLQCRIRSVVTSHNAFAYLAKRYALEVIPIAELSPHAEPSPKRLIEIVNLVREKQVKYIFFETLASPRLAETLAREAGIQTLVFHSIEGGMLGENGVPETYFSLMSENLTHLRTALECL